MIEAKVRDQLSTTRTIAFRIESGVVRELLLEHVIGPILRGRGVDGKPTQPAHQDGVPPRHIASG
jgi:hypothetical protein